MENLRVALKEELTKLKTKSIKALLVRRYERLMSYGQYKEVAERKPRISVKL
jgi:acetyl-CoA carboxylase carboxyl transferase subunit alpha